MSSLRQSELAVHAASPLVAPATAEWFAIKTRSRHEKKVATELQQRGIETFLPVVSQVRNWSDRKKVVEFPLFSCYAFVNITPTPPTRLAVLSAHGVVGFVGPHGQATPIPASQIEDLRTVLMSEVPLWPRPFLKVGQRVRIRGGALNGLEGILVGAKGERQLVLSVDTIQRSVSMSIEGYDLEPA